MKRALASWLCASGLLACVVDGSLGSHDSASRDARPAAEQHGDQLGGDAQADAESTAISHPGLDAATHADARPEGEPATEPAPSEPTHDAASEPAHDTSVTDPPALPDAAEPAVEPPTEPPPNDPPATSSCDTPTDNACLICDQASCCEPRRSCLEIEGCACRLECRYAEHPADCLAACPEAPDRYEPWLLCLQEHCADSCVL